MPSARHLSLTCTVLAATACAQHRADESPAATAPASTASVTGALGDTLRIMRGASGSFDGERLVIHVDSATDSRCPKGVQCVWAGEVAVFLRLDVGGATSAAAVHTTLEPKHATVAGYDVAVVDVTPYPGTEPANARLAQTALLLITRR